MVKIGSLELSGRVALAPMAGVSDFAFRHMCFRFGAAYAVTEMVSAKALVYNDAKTRELLYIPEKDRPCGTQIFGHEPEVMGEAAALALEISGADVIDINMGCPVGKIVRSGDGSALMKDPELAGRIVEAVCAAVPVPVTVKFRKGFDGGSVNAVGFSRVCEQAGASALTVHGRTRVQMYAGKADWDIIRDVKSSVGIPVFANGDVFTAADAEHILRYTGCDGVSIGRGSFGDPWLFAQANAAVEGKQIPPLPPLAERMDIAEEQIRMLASVAGERRACVEARHQLPWYLHGVSHASYYKQQLVRLENLQQLHTICSGIKKDLK